MSFSAQIAHFGTGTQRKLQRRRKGVIIKLFGAVVRDTPVLTGRLRANWRISEKTPLFENRTLVDPNNTIVQQEIISFVPNTTGEFPVYLTNSLPYAARIEFDGWSHTKAPEGMMRKNVIRFNRLMRLKDDNI